MLPIFAAKGKLRSLEYETIQFHQQCFRYSWPQSKLISLETKFTLTTNMYKVYMKQNWWLNEIHIRGRNRPWEMWLTCIYFVCKYIKNPFHCTLTTQIQIALHAIHTQILKGDFIANLMSKKVRKTVVRHILEVLCDVAKYLQIHKYKGQSTGESTTLSHIIWISDKKYLSHENRQP